MTRYWLRMTASKRITESGTVADLSRLRITSLQGLETFTQIRELDLSRNMLHTLNVCRVFVVLWSSRDVHGLGGKNHVNDAVWFYLLVCA